MLYIVSHCCFGYFYSKPRSSSAKDDPAYRTLVRHNLAFKDCISRVELPLLDWEGNEKIEPWPVLLPHDLAKKFVEHDAHSILGQGSAEYWAKMEQEFGVPKPGGDKPAVGVALWGDEGEIFDSCQYMALSWMSENCPKWKDAKLSRYLIALLPTESYLMRGQLNVTLQCLLAEVVKSLTVFSEVGIDDVLFGAVVALKGDWKFLAQCLNLKRKPSCDAFCFLCEGTLSNISPITDRSAEALWKTCVPSSAVGCCARGSEPSPFPPWFGGLGCIARLVPWGWARPCQFSPCSHVAAAVLCRSKCDLL